MMSSYLYRHNGATALRNMSRGAFRASVRYSSSKKSDNKPEDPQAAAPPKKQALAKVKSDNKSSSKNDAAPNAPAPKTASKRFARNYIAFKDLPKPSKEFQDMSTEQFHASLNMTSVPEALPKHEELMPFSGFKYDFSLHAKHRLPTRRSLTGTGAKKPVSAIEPNLALLGISIDADTLASGLDEHPLRESITGMCVMNPLMKEIKNKSLWEFFPETKAYGASPFGTGTGLNVFKEWEDSKNAKLKSFEEKKQKEERNFRDFCKNLQESNSFVRKSAPKVASKEESTPTAPDAASVKATSKQATSKSAETSGRRKLDRGLLRQYRKYRKEQYAKDSKDDKEDE
ncbi:hypothetical protein JCM33374_g2698 [Metschnikowia sp. JCM 33374]|nr:hypothetical protein JCM33374_g2698 [Metschnikowia sp. JCM 33374]